MSNVHFSNKGYCPVCEEKSEFRAYSDNFRSSYICVRCRSVPRHRALMHVLARFFPNWRNLRIHESSPGPVEVSRKLKRECQGYVATQYDPAQSRGSIDARGWRNEDLEHQTFGNEVFDLVITQDVFEHLLNPDLAIREIERTLVQGGAHIATVPLVRKTAPSRRRAQQGVDNKLEHILPPTYHQNPIDTCGSLVTVDWGFDIAAFFDSQANLNTTILFIDNLDIGIRAELCEVLLCLKGWQLTI